MLPHKEDASSKEDCLTSFVSILIIENRRTIPNIQLAVCLCLVFQSQRAGLTVANL